MNTTLLILAHTTHIVAICVWIGVMLFNLIVGFPLLRARSNSILEYTQWLSEQGVKAAPWLYLLIGTTFISGWMIYFGTPHWREAQVNSDFLSDFAIKNALLLVMLGCHLHSTYYVWPRIFFAVEHELQPLITRYQITILMSAAIGLTAIALAATRLVY